MQSQLVSPSLETHPHINKRYNLNWAHGGFFCAEQTRILSAFLHLNTIILYPFWVPEDDMEVSIPLKDTSIYSSESVDVTHSDVCRMDRWVHK